MTTQQSEWNKAIAEFMGCKIDTGYAVRTNKLWDFPDPDAGVKCRIEYLKYHSSWDWLMPVVHKIKDWQHLPEHMFMGTTLERQIAFISVTELPIYTSINKVFEAVVTFIEWYNLQLDTAPKSPRRPPA